MKKLLMAILATSLVLVLMGSIVAHAYKVSKDYDGMSIGVWMFDSASVFDRSDWLGDGPYEPINILFKVKASSSSQAMTAVRDALADVGYTDRAGHGRINYHGYLGGSFYSKDTAAGHCYSDGAFYLNNNHGRIFGARYNDGYYYISGAFSREKGITHAFIEFNAARDKVMGIKDLSGWSYEGQFEADNESEDHTGYIKVLKYVP